MNEKSKEKVEEGGKTKKKEDERALGHFLVYVCTMTDTIHSKEIEGGWGGGWRAG